ncbi:MAG: response regulator transcription factor [Actinobacteria bacterium]|nr:response regulator transcription factor [Actinomycetota bacterium]
MPTILLVEDEAAIAEGLTASLEADGFRPVWVSSGDAAISAWERERPDLVLLDLMLPGTSGTEVCRRLRARSNVPIIMVTARGAEVDRVVGLELGADDYVTKPFSTRELIARIRAVLRRDVRTNAPGSDEVVEAAGVRVDPARREVTVSGRVLQLPPKEFDLLEVLVRNAGLVRTRTQLVDEVWGNDYVGDTRTLDVHIARLRRRIEQDPHHPTRIRTVRGVGYRFADR